MKKILLYILLPVLLINFVLLTSCTKKYTVTFCLDMISYNRYKGKCFPMDGHCGGSLLFCDVSFESIYKISNICKKGKRYLDEQSNICCLRHG